VKNIPLTKHLVARRLWRPLARTVSFVQRLFLQSYDWLFTKRKLDNACFKMLTPMIRLHSWLARKAGQQRPVQLFHPSSFAYDLAAIGAALLAPIVRWESACHKRMNQETDPRLRHDSSRN
jgi:hypothetical protein